MSEKETEYEANFQPEDAELFYEIPATTGPTEGVQWIAYCRHEQRAITLWSSDLHRVNTAVIHHNQRHPSHVVQVYTRTV